jgi:hypothetical protein
VALLDTIYTRKNNFQIGFHEQKVVFAGAKWNKNATVNRPLSPALFRLNCRFNKTSLSCIYFPEIKAIFFAA